LKNQEENERLVDSFSIQNSNERITSSPSYFWTGILVGAGSIFSLIFTIIKYQEIILIYINYLNKIYNIYINV
jgi:uncharacterized membrane protein